MARGGMILFERYAFWRAVDAAHRILARG